MTDPQLACLAICAGPIFIGALWSLGDLAGLVATVSPAPQPGDTFRAFMGHASRLVFLVPAVLTGAAALGFGLSRKVRP